MRSDRNGSFWSPNERPRVPRQTGKTRRDRGARIGAAAAVRLPSWRIGVGKAIAAVFLKNAWTSAGREAGVSRGSVR